MRRPNILVFFSDQQRWDTCGCYGQPLPITPHLDQMAAEGVRFEHSFTCQPVCGPARACMQTGHYATEVGCETNNNMLPSGCPTIASMLSEAGYETSYIGKWHLASAGAKDGPDDFRVKPVPPERRGGYRDFWLASDVLEFTSHGYDGHMFDGEMRKREFPGGRYRVDAQTDWLLEYLETRDDDRPFFLFVSYIEPHHQNDHHCYEGPHGSKNRFRDFVGPGDLNGTEGDWRESYPDYLGCINSLDENLGRVRAGLHRLGLAQNTLVIYTSDHGSHFRTRNSEYKRSCHEASIRTPLVACGPGFEGGTVEPALASLIDIPATILSAAGVDIPESFQGRPLQQLSEGHAADDWPDDVFIQISESHTGRAIRTSRWKYEIGYEHDEDPVYREMFLYDLEADPYERNNLVDDPAHAEVRRELHMRVKARMESAGESID